MTPTFQNKTITYLSTTLTAAPTQLRVQSRSTQGFRGHIWTCPPTIMSSIPNTYPVPDAHRTRKVLGCTRGRVYDGPWHKDADHRCRQTTTGLDWVFGLAIRVKVAGVEEQGFLTSVCEVDLLRLLTFAHILLPIHLFPYARKSSVLMAISFNSSAPNAMFGPGYTPNCSPAWGVRLYDVCWFKMCIVVGSPLKLIGSWGLQRSVKAT